MKQKKKQKEAYGPIGTISRAVGQFRVRDIPTDFVSIGSGLVTRDLSALAQGTEYFQRFGRRVIIDHVDIMGTLVGGQTNSVADDAYNTVCMALVTAAPGTAPSGWSAGLPIGPQITTGVKKVLWAKRFVINTNAKDSTGYIPNAMIVKERIPVHEPFEYVASGDVVATNQSLYLIAISDSVAVVNPGFNTGFSVVVFH